MSPDELFVHDRRLTAEERELYEAALHEAEDICEIWSERMCVGELMDRIDMQLDSTFPDFMGALVLNMARDAAVEPYRDRNVYGVKARA